MPNAGHMLRALVTQSFAVLLQKNTVVPNVDVLYPLDARSIAVLLQKNNALVVLEQNVVLSIVTFDSF